jgi:CubicO group peptidase (beta-lactamase class C family)
MSFERTLSVLRQGIDDGLHPGAQICVMRKGVIVLDAAVGISRPGVAMTRDTINLWMSSTKPVVAVAICMLWERGLIDLDDRVERFIPAFGQFGKAPITIRHLLTHTGGFRPVSLGFQFEPWEQIITQICSARLEARWVPGERAGYHPSSSWYILGELIRVIDGRMFNRFVRQEIFEPLGMCDSWIGIPVDQFEQYGERIACFWEEKSASTDMSVAPPSAELCALPSPGANGRGPVRELAGFYAGLTTLLAPETLAAMLLRQREGKPDATFGHTIDFGLGFIINSNRYGIDTVPYSYGRHASDSTFGHSGNQSSCAFCDPKHELIVAWACNRMCGDKLHQQRQRAINEAVYEDLEREIVDGGS